MKCAYEAIMQYINIYFKSVFCSLYLCTVWDILLL